MEHDLDIENFIGSLPVLDDHLVPSEDSCPICLVSFNEILSDVSEADSSFIFGVTKLDICGHLFCRRDLIEWIRSMHGSCPSCRRCFLDIRPPSESDGESSDGGEYIPNEEEEDEEDSFMIDTDGFTDADDFDIEMDDVNSDLYQDFDAEFESDGMDASSEWGLTDGDSLSYSEGDASLESVEVFQGQDDAGVVVHGETEVEDSVQDVFEEPK